MMTIVHGSSPGSSTNVAVATAVFVPKSFSAVNRKLDSEVSTTAIPPLLATAPIPRSMTTLVEPETSHSRSADPPVTEMRSGVIENWWITGTGPVATVTSRVALPCGLLAVST